MIQAGGKLVGLRDVAVNARKALAALDDLLGAVETALRKKRREHAVCRRLPRMERFAGGTAVLLHAAGLGRGDAHRVGEPLAVEPDELAGGDAGRDAAERPREVPAAFVVARRRPTGAHRRLESHRIGEHEVGAAHRLALGKRKERGENRRARMEHDAAHVGVVEVEDVPHLAVGERRIKEAEAKVAAEHAGLRAPACLLEHGDELRNGGMTAAGKRTADPVEHAAAGFVPGGFREVVEACVGEVGAQALGERHRTGREVLVHRGLVRGPGSGCQVRPVAGRGGRAPA
jgi:hypothetical protein